MQYRVSTAEVVALHKIGAHAGEEDVVECGDLHCSTDAVAGLCSSMLRGPAPVAEAPP
jgi:hypothetical protein